MTTPVAAAEQPVLAAAAAGPPPERRRSHRGSSRYAGAFLLPNLALVLVFILYPLVNAFLISGKDQQSLGDPTWIGLDNYTRLVKDEVFWETLRNTVLFTLGTIPVGMGIGLGVAVLLNGLLPARTFFRTVIFLPLVLSGVATGILGAWMFDQYDGFINKTLATMGITGPTWQSTGTWALVSVMLMTIWVRIGFDMLIYLAGLQTIDPDLYEAARIDGAGPWQQFRRITFPLLGPSTFFLLIMNLIYSFQVFDTVYAMTRGGPGNSTTFLVNLAYKTGFDERGSGELGYAATIGVVIYIITLLITGLQWRFSRTRDQVG